MRHSVIIALVAIATVAALASCHRKKVVDPIHDTKPVDTTWWSGTPSVSENGEILPSKSRFPLDKFYELGQAGDTASQRKLVDDYRMHLTANVVSHYPKVTSHKNIHFYLATGYAKDVKSGNGKAYSGNFRNELLIVINDPAAKDTVFLACGNGMLSPIDFDSFEYVIDFGTAVPWKFTILPGQGLAHHLPSLQAWGEVASTTPIPIKDKKTREVVSPDKYLNYIGEWESILFAYDTVDVLNNYVHNLKGQEVDFERRMQESREANAKIAAQKRAKATKRRR